MRLLPRFTKKPVIISTIQSDSAHHPQSTLASNHTADKSQVDHSDQHHNLQSSRFTLSPQTPPAFTPTSIPELHPEYAHSEPYCFVPRTESARIVVDRVRGALGQPSLDRANILKEQGLVVVRGPSANAPHPLPDVTPHPNSTSIPVSDSSALHSPPPKSSVSQSLSVAKSPPRTPVPLKVEVPSTADNTFADSDDDPSNENENTTNIPLSEGSPVQSPKASFSSRGKRTPGNMSFRIKSKNRKTKSRKGSQRSLTSPILLQPNTTPENDLEAASTVLSAADDQHIPKRSTYGRSPSDIPTEPGTGLSNESFEEILQRAMDRTPQELLAPIVVPRTSAVFGEGLISPLNESVMLSTSPSPRVKSSPDSQRFADADESQLMEPDLPSSAPVASPIKSSTSYGNTSAVSVSDTTSPPPAAMQSLRSRRKSKPFPPLLASPLSTEGSTSKSTLSQIPAPEPLSREPSLGMLSDETGEEDTNDDNEKGATEESLFPVQAPTSGAAVRQRCELPLDVSSYSRVQPVRSALARRASTAGKRKTVSFHDAAPVIIEPNLRAPSLSVPRSATLAKESPSQSQQSLGSTLWRTRDSVTWCRPSVPLVDVHDEEDSDINDVMPFSENYSNRGDADIIASPNSKLAGQGFNTPFSTVKVSQRLMVKEGNTVTTSTYEMKMTGEEDGDTIQAEHHNSSLAGAQDIRQRSDISTASRSDASFASFENVDTEMRGRSSVRISKKDKAGIREATRRQSMAVAQAMSEQIRGVPRSAMLAYSENEVIIEDDERADEEDRVTVEGFRTTPSWHARRSGTALRSMRFPSFKDGGVPPPPPPPPFQPVRLSTRSMGLPPPPPPVPHLRPDGFGIIGEAGLRS